MKRATHHLDILIFELAAVTGCHFVRSAMGCVGSTFCVEHK